MSRQPGRVSRGAFPAPYFTEEVRRQLEEMFGDRIYAGDRFASRVQEIDLKAGTVVAVHEVPSPAIAIARGAGGVWATSGDAGAIAELGDAG